MPVTASLVMNATEPTQQLPITTDFYTNKDNDATIIRLTIGLFMALMLIGVFVYCYKLRKVTKKNIPHIQLSNDETDVITTQPFNRL